MTLAATQTVPAASRIALELRRHAPFLAFGFVMLAVSLVVKGAYAETLRTDLILHALSLALFWPLLIPALVPMLFFRVAVYDKPDSALRGLIAAFRPYLTANGRLLPGLLMLFSISLFMAGFASLKASITYVQPFAWDEAFDRWDVLLHFGYRPWELLQPILGYGPVTALINVNYHFWFLSLTMFWLHFGLAERSQVLRFQAIAAFMLTWSVGGVIFAMAFASAGPCFYGLVGLSPDPYAPLMDYLRATSQAWPVWALDLQDELWRNFANHGTADATKGISAMPSMHNAQCLLLVLAVWNKGALVRGLAIAHGLLVFLGSVHLGWHYAVDAYLAFAVAIAAWFAAGRFARR